MDAQREATVPLQVALSKKTGLAQVEILLFSLGACQEITTKAFANAMGVPLTKVSVKLTGHIDLRGFFAVDESVRAGFNKILGSSGDPTP